jgi:PhzF family phenazine biosynthesis protein
MSRTFDFRQVDVFTSQCLKGNPLAVVHAAQDLSGPRMAEFARWTNLSETAFLLPPTDPAADYRVRIFTPARELPFAGHPTLGSCAAWLAAGGRPAQRGCVVQQCGAGLVRIREREGRLAFAAPPMQRSGSIDDTTLDRIARALRVDARAFIGARWLVNGPEWAVVMLRTRDELLALDPDFGAFGDLAVGALAPAPDGDTAFEVRAFAPALGVPEDPVTGSLQAGIAQWLIGEGLAPSRYLAAQGTAMGRAGRVHVERDGPDIWIGGDVVVCIEGRVTL